MEQTNRNPKVCSGMPPRDGEPDLTRDYRETHPAYRPLVYICSLNSGDVEANVERTEMFCRFALDKGVIPVAPHLMFPRFMRDNDPDERELALFMDVVLMGKCREVWVLGDVVSRGMRLEIAKACQWRKTVRYFNAAFEEVESYV